MTTITIPTKLAKIKEELVAVPRKEYEEFLSWQKNIRDFIPTAAEKKSLKRARTNLSKREYTDLKSLKYELGFKN